MTRAVVVGSGPNGLAAAIRLAQAGIEVTVLEAAGRPGGGARTSELTVPGLLHDDCAAFHPTGVASPYLKSLDLGRFGLEWLWPEIDLAHPLDDGRAGAIARGDMAVTTASIGDDAQAWQRLFDPFIRNFDKIVADAFVPALHVPKHPVAFGRFGPLALLPGKAVIRRWEDDPARALYLGIAAHAFGRLDTPLSGSVGLLLGSAAHAVGWPVAKGGTGSISGAMIGLLESLGGRVVTGVHVTSLDQAKEHSSENGGGNVDLVMLDTSPTGALRIVGDRMPQRVRRAFSRYKYGPAVHKVDFAIEGDVPWTNEDCRRAGTLHVGGTAEEILEVEAATARGVMPTRPFVLVGQQYLADTSRSVGSLNPLWAYAHVPAGYSGDATEAVVSQIERFAPGFRDRIVATSSRTATEIEAYNENYVGGDIGAGANTAMQIAFRPRPALNPYMLGVPGVYLCSSATPPGGGVHGMAGFNAAETALKRL